ncbi:MAG: Mrp/NBP35 family ATP-binding protein [Acidimicrobiales bacterium]|nr:Mrp/NBP35 family ATP-binding protein [Acidimicrobiales bacterium]
MSGSLANPVPPPSAQEIQGLLRGVIDPELGSDIVDLGMVKRVDVSPEGDVTVSIALTTTGCPLRAQIQKDIRARVGSLPGVRSTHLNWTELSSEEKSAAMARARWNARENAPATMVPPTTKVLAIGSGKGGVGKSSITVNLAVALALRGLRVGVMDADIWGFSVPRMLGLEGRLRGTMADDQRKQIIPLRTSIGDGELEVVSMGLLVEDEESALMWRGLMLNRAVQHFLEDVQWGDLAYLLIDLPPGTGDVQMGLARLLPRSDMIVVTTPALAAQKVAARAVNMARKCYLRVAGIIENMSEFTCEHGTTYRLFGAGGGEALARAAGAPLLGQVPLEPAVASGADDGRPVALGEGVAAEAFRAIAERIVTDAAPPVDMASCSARLLDAAIAALDAAPTGVDTSTAT